MSNILENMTDGIEVAPVRSLDDFLLGSARFQIPNFRDLEKWGNRVANNLMYYQTNYLLTALIVFGICGFVSPIKFIGGLVGVVVAFHLFCYITNNTRTATQFKKDHPIFGVLIILVSSYFIVYLLGSVIVFLFGILLPIAIIFVHASMRLRNIKNKLANKIELMGLKKTPMGMLLEALGDERPEIQEFSKSFREEKKFLGLYKIDH